MAQGATVRRDQTAVATRPIKMASTHSMQLFGGQPNSSATNFVRASIVIEIHYPKFAIPKSLFLFAFRFHLFCKVGA